MTASRRSERLYLTDILDAIDKALAYTREGRDAFFADPKTQDAVVRNLEIIGEVAKRLAPGTRRAHPDIPWPDIVGMRDRVIHGYFNVNLQVVWGRRGE